LKWILTPLIVAFALMITLGMAIAQDNSSPATQGEASSATQNKISPTAQSETPADDSSFGIVRFTGRVEPGRGVIYNTGLMTAGDTLYFYARRASGNLDPMVGVFPGEVDRSVLAKDIWSRYDELIANGQDPISALSDAVDEFSLAWDDDSGDGYDAALAFEVPKEGGQYQILVAGSPGVKTFGAFELTAGLNAPNVLSGKATPTGTVDIQLQEVGVIQAVKMLTGTLSPRNSEDYYPLVDLQQGETLRVYAEVISGTIKPVLTLKDFGDKPRAVANYNGADDTAHLEYTFPELTTNYQIIVTRGGDNLLTSRGDYALKFSRNVTDDLASDIKPFGPPIRQPPIVVRASLRIDQVTSVDQVSENFSVVANLKFVWQDSLLAFSPDECDCSYIILRGERQLNDYLRDHEINRFPYFTVFNQQGTRNTQNLITLIQPDGTASYFERFTATLQAPDFDFRQFPFDTQDFYLRLQSLYSDSVFVYAPAPGKSGFGDQLGEEEWIIEDFDTDVIDVDGRSQFVFHFPSSRHLNFYLFRILLPILLIILVSWFSFFLKDYGRRVDVTSANLLIFVAYNFTIAGELPRLGYLTFMDFILISTFVVSALVIIINVWFRRLEQDGKGELASKIDKIAIWLYPVLYIVGGILVYLWFYVISPYLKSR
jgi:hypothetical protein